ncbi:MAG: EamA family transporter [Phycisphaera sp.]|nr:EamA family transporter [Phycisphaera sp.]
MHHVLFIAVCLIWGTSFLLMKIGLTVFGPTQVGLWRVGMGALALGAIWAGMRRRWPFDRRDAGRLLLISVIGYAMPFCLQPYIVRVVDAQAGHGSAFAGMMPSFVPIVTAVVSLPLLGVLPTRRQVMGLIGALGFMFVLFGGELTHGVGVGVLLLAALTPVGYAVANTLVKRWFADKPAVAVVMCTLAMAMVLIAPIAVSGPRPNWGHEWLAGAIGAMVVLGVVGTGLTTFFFYRIIQSHGPLYAGMVAYVVPCVAVVEGWLWGERITPTQLIALVGVLGMVALAQSGSRPVAVTVAGVD